MRVLITVLILGFATTLAKADDAPTESHRRAAVELLKVMDVEATMMGGASAMANAMIQQNPMLAPYRSTILEWSARHMTWENVKPGFVALYAEFYSESELKELRVFYQTPTGKKSVQVAPELMMRGSMLGSSRCR